MQTTEYTALDWEIRATVVRYITLSTDLWYYLSADPDLYRRLTAQHKTILRERLERIDGLDCVECCRTICRLPHMEIFVDVHRRTSRVSINTEHLTSSCRVVRSNPPIVEHRCGNVIGVLVVRLADGKTRVALTNVDGHRVGFGASQTRWPLGFYIHLCVANDSPWVRWRGADGYDRENEFRFVVECCIYDRGSRVAKRDVSELFRHLYRVKDPAAHAGLYAHLKYMYGDSTDRTRISDGKDDDDDPYLHHLRLRDAPSLVMKPCTYFSMTHFPPFYRVPLVRDTTTTASERSRADPSRRAPFVSIF